MPRKHTTIPMQGIKTALLYAALILERVLPMAWTLMPENALMILVLATGCSALANRIV